MENPTAQATSSRSIRYHWLSEQIWPFDSKRDPDHWDLCGPAGLEDDEPWTGSLVIVRSCHRVLQESFDSSAVGELLSEMEFDTLFDWRLPSLRSSLEGQLPDWDLLRRGSFNCQSLGSGIWEDWCSKGSTSWSANLHQGSLQDQGAGQYSRLLLLVSISAVSPFSVQNSKQATRTECFERGWSRSLPFSRHRANDPMTEDSTLITILRESGAVLYCKTNVPTAMLIAESVNNTWGRTLKWVFSPSFPNSLSGLVVIHTSHSLLVVFINLNYKPPYFCQSSQSILYFRRFFGRRVSTPSFTRIASRGRNRRRWF